MKSLLIQIMICIFISDNRIYIVINYLIIVIVIIGTKILRDFLLKQRVSRGSNTICGLP